MNAVLSNQNTFSAPVQPARTQRPARRQLVGGYPVAQQALERFNLLLERLGRAPMDLDELATAARQLARPGGAERPSGWIVKRLRRAVTVGLMAADPSWPLDKGRADAVDLVTGYLRDTDDLIPDELPRVGRLDDALVVEAAWPALAGEVRDYLDYCRVRRTEAELRECAESAFAFSRADWAEASKAEKAWIAHCREAGRRSYLPTGAAPRFRVC